MNRAIAIIDGDIDEMLKRPGMFVGGTSPESHHCFFVLLLSHLSLRARIMEADFEWKRISDALLREMTGNGSGACGPNTRLCEYYGDASFNPHHQNYGNVMLFYRDFVEQLRAAMDRR